MIKQQSRKSQSKLKMNQSARQQKPHPKKNAQQDDKENGLNLHSLHKHLANKLNLTGKAAFRQDSVGVLGNSNFQKRGRSRSTSPLTMTKKDDSRSRNSARKDEKFIQKLFCQNQKSKVKKSKQEGRENSHPEEQLFVEKLIKHTVESYKKKPLSDSLSQNEGKQGRQLKKLQQELKYLHIHSTNLVFKAFDLTVACKEDSEHKKPTLGRCIEEVVLALESLVKIFGIEEQMKEHAKKYQQPAKKLEVKICQKGQLRSKRCHTESLKIPVEEYLSTLQGNPKIQNKEERNFGIFNNEAIMENQFQKKVQEKIGIQKEINSIWESFHRKGSNTTDDSEMIKFVSQKNLLEQKKEDEEIYIAIRSYKPSNEHEIPINPGDRITVLQKGEQRWLGFKNGSVGYFPKTCLFDD